jgi:hypothetical protein
MNAKFLFLVITSVIIASCSKSTERTLLGKWNVSDTGFYIVNSIFVSDTLDVSEYGTMTFRQGGIGSFKHDDIKEDIEWAVNKEEVTLTIGERTPITYTILLDASQYQTWEYEKVDSSITNSISSKQEWISLFRLTKLKSDF